MSPIEKGDCEWENVDRKMKKMRIKSKKIGGEMNRKWDWKRQKDGEKLMKNKKRRKNGLK